VKSRLGELAARNVFIVSCAGLPDRVQAARRVVCNTKFSHKTGPLICAFPEHNSVQNYYDLNRENGNHRGTTVTKLKPTGHLCNDCRQPVPSKAKICPNCNAYQDWRRYVAVGQTNLALLVAAFSVLTTLFTVGLPFYLSRGSDIRLLLEKAADSNVTFLVRNDGRSGGVVTFLTFIAEDKGSGSQDQKYIFQFKHGGTYVEAGKELRVLTDASSLDSGFCTWMAPKYSPPIVSPGIIRLEQKAEEHFQNLQCKFHASQASFYAPAKSNLTLDADCFGIWLSLCVEIVP